MMILWVVPATNILALTYTGAVLGVEIAVARVIAAVSTAFIVGLVLHYIFDRNISVHEEITVSANPSRIVERNALILFGLLVATLLLPNYIGVGRPYIFKVEVFAILM